MEPDRPKRSQPDHYFPDRLCRASTATHLIVPTPYCTVNPDKWGAHPWTLLPGQSRFDQGHLDRIRNRQHRASKPITRCRLSCRSAFPMVLRGRWPTPGLIACLTTAGTMAAGALRPRRPRDPRITRISTTRMLITRVATLTRKIFSLPTLPMICRSARVR